MEPETVLEVARRALELTLLLMGILLVPALVVGLLVSMFQAATQINEMTLSFIPKLLVTMFVIIIGGPFMLRLLTDYALDLFHDIPGLLG
ncbi:MAG: flagellar biosynthesis protein FliQ [Gammaproteobacteria bacterium]|nr:flagellar biosynthesis protein FliQ [Gammaproteobacteria bacterium]